MMAKKEYQGVAELFWVIYLKQCYQNSPVLAAGQDFNRKIPFNQVFVESF